MAVKETSRQQSSRGMAILSRRSSQEAARPEGLKKHLGRCASPMEGLADGMATPEERRLLTRVVSALAALGENTGAGRLAMTLSNRAEDGPGAICFLEQAANLFAAGREKRGEAAAHYRLGRSLMLVSSADTAKRARRHLDKALVLSREAGLTEGATAARQALDELDGR